jgi:acetoin utilization deacetylase AcuC-like enzyme
MKIFFDDEMREHVPGPGHPERPERVVAVEEALRLARPDLEFSLARAAPRELLELAHASAHVDRILRLRGRTAVLDPDTFLSASSVDAALLAVGHAVAAAEWAVTKKTPAFALVRPPGHHAESARSMGFCVFNNIAIAAAFARTLPGVDRVLIVDWDVHHGNGTQEIFYDRSDVFFFSTHQSPLYPGTGAVQEVGVGQGCGYTRNVPLAAGAGDDEISAAFQSALVPAAQRFAPDLILISAGFDAHHRDPIGGLTVTSEGFAHLMGIVVGLAEELCEGRLAMVLEGGYDLQGLVSSVLACLDEVS